MLSIQNTNRRGTQGFAENFPGQLKVGNANMLRAELSSNPLKMK